VTQEPWLCVHAGRRPERVALEEDRVALTWRELARRAAVAAGSLDVLPGDRVALVLPAGLDLAVWLHACWLARAAPVPLDPRLTPAERERALRGAARVIEGPPPSAGPAGAPARGRPDDVVLVVQTSGTTAAPVPVALTRANVEANAVGSALALGLDPEERWACPLPLTHVGGLMVLLRSLVYGTTATLVPPPFDAHRTLRALEDATLVSLVPTMLGRLLDAGLTRPGRLRAVLLGGGPAAPALLERALAAGLPVAQTYGLTEACSQVTVSAPGEPATAGWPLHGVEVRLAPDGEILVAGPTVAGGKELATGDLGHLDERGRLTVIGRKADTIVTGGENVAPAEVEAVLLAHPGVLDAAVLGRPDPEWGERVAAQVVGQVDPGALRAFAAERLVAYKVPKTIEVVPGPLPRTASGKLLRRAL